VSASTPSLAASAGAIPLTSSAGAVGGCSDWAIGTSGSYEVTAEHQITDQLGGATLPITGLKVRYLTTRRDNGAQPLIVATDGTARKPVFVRTVAGDQEVFFASSPDVVNIAFPPDDFPHAFAILAPSLVFLHHAAGDRIWHFPGHYANFTIDDLWLREPYGYVNYRDLLQQMEQHNFHTTIAFIPWNFDRSDPAVVALFRAHPDFYSICVHGDNHDHQEFGSFRIRPLHGQIYDMKQALARMAKFGQLTGLPWDPVMVFPHKISPVETLAFLKRYNYWSTVNGEFVPLDTQPPATPTFGMRPATLDFADFPVLRRYSAEHPIPDDYLKIDAFLGNPMLFYSHEAYFAHGIDAFDTLADTVNRFQPDTEWRNLGYITRHLYLEKRRDDTTVDVRLLSAVAEFTNRSKRDIVFFVDKEENNTIPYTVTVDGQPVPFAYANGHLQAHFTAAGGTSHQFAIEYRNDLNLAQIDISKRSLRIAALRYLSDFRDNFVSRSAPGRWFIRSYVVDRSLWNCAAVSAVLAAIFMFWYRRTHRDKLRAS